MRWWSVCVCVCVWMWMRVCVWMWMLDPFAATTSNTAASGDAAGFLMPQHAETFRWVCYVLECVFVSLGILLCFIGLFGSMERYMMINNLPSVAAKCEYLMGRLKSLAYVGFVMMLSMLFLVVGALPMILVRASAVAFLSACATGLLFLVWCVWVIAGSDGVDVQIAEAHVVLAASRVRELHERDASPLPPPRRVQSVSPGGNA